MHVRSPEPALEKEAKTDIYPLSGKPFLDGMGFSLDLLKYVISFFVNVADEKTGCNEAEEIMINEEPEIYGVLATLNRRLNFLFQENASVRRDRPGKMLLNQIVCGGPYAADFILEKHPRLMFHTFTVKNPAGYTITATP